MDKTLLLLAHFLIPFALVTGQYNNNNCDPGICGRIPGLVYNADLDQCAWPDEIGCSLKDIGYSTDCGGIAEFDLKPADFSVTLPAGRKQEQYFIVCVPETTAEDRLQAKALSTEQRARPPLPTGPLAPRLLGCPEDQVFNAETKVCETMNQKISPVV